MVGILEVLGLIPNKVKKERTYHYYYYYHFNWFLL